MSLIVYDMGQRIETPVQPRPRRVAASAASASIAPIAAHQERHGQSAAQQQAVQAYREQEQKEPATVAFIRDILHRDVRTLVPSASLAEAWQVLAETGYHHLPVIDPEHRVLAMFSEGDLLRALVRQSHNNDPKFWQTNIMALATHPVFCVQEQTDIRQTSNLLYHYNIGALPVLNQHNALCGIVTRSDILRLLSHYGPLQFWA